MTPMSREQRRCRWCDKPAVARRRDRLGRRTWKARRHHDLCPRHYRDALNSLNAKAWKGAA